MGKPILLDGFIVGAAALVAARRTPSVVPSLIAAHQSAEPAHAPLLEVLQLRPLLSLDMSLGEGAGAALAVPLLKSATRLMHDLRTYAEANLDPGYDSRGLK